PVANRDPELRSDPDQLDVTRGGVGHLAFGHGIPHCLGAPLARMEMRIGFPALLRRFPGLAEVPGSAQFRSFSVLYGLSALEVTWWARCACAPTATAASGRGCASSRRGWCSTRTATASWSCSTSTPPTSPPPARPWPTARPA